MIVTLMLAMLLAQEPPRPSPGGAYKIGNGVTQPKLIHKVEPEYSEEARRAKWQGTVELLIVVSETGVPSTVRVTRALGLGLDQKAIEAVMQWRFEPGRKAVVPVPVIATVQVNFRLFDSWQLTNIRYIVPPDASEPKLLHSVFPSPPPLKTGLVTVTVSINERGEPTEVLKSGETFEPLITEAVRNWRFTPAMKDGTAVPSRATIEILMIPPAPAAPRTPPVATTQPELAEKTIPAYSDEARTARLAGSVQVGLAVNPNGVVIEPKVTRGLGLGLDEEALAAVKNWKFRPATSGGVAVLGMASVEVSFAPQASGHYYMTKAVFDTPAGADRPTLLHCAYPTAIPPDIGSVAITMTIDERGIPRDVKIDRSSTPFDKLIVSLAQEWRFKSGTKDNSPIAVQAHFEIVAAGVQ